MLVFQPDRHLLAKFVAAHAKDIQGSLLDVGGGDGRRYRAFFPHVKAYTTLDPDASFHPTVVASVERMPLPDRSVDGILCTEVLMDVYRPEEAVRELARVLKPGGVLVLTVSFMGAIYNEPHNYWRFTPFVLKRLLQPHFREVTVERRGGYFTLRAQQWIRYQIERRRLYDRRFLGALFSHLSRIHAAWSQWRDDRDSTPANQKFAIGYNVLARK